MPIRKTVTDPVSGEAQAGTVMDVVASNEPMTSLELQNGTKIRIKLSISEVILLDKLDPNGKPSYSFTAQLVTQVYLPEEST